MRANGTIATTEPAPADELDGRILGIIGLYRMGAAFDALELSSRRLAREPEPVRVAVPTEGSIVDGVYHPAETAS